MRFWYLLVKMLKKTTYTLMTIELISFCLTKREFNIVFIVNLTFFQLQLFDKRKSGRGTVYWCSTYIWKRTVSGILTFSTNCFVVRAFRGVENLRGNFGGFSFFPIRRDFIFFFGLYKNQSWNLSKSMKNSIFTNNILFIIMRTWFSIQLNAAKNWISC